MTIRVLWLIKGLGPGGAERLLVSLARAHDRDVVDVDVAYIVAAKDALVGDLESLRVDVHFVGGRTWPMRVRRLIRSGRYDVVHAHSPLVASAARVAARTIRPRPRIVTTEHNAWETYAWATRVLNQVTAPLDDYTLAVSAAALAGISSERARRRSELLVHGVDLEAVRSDRGQRDRVRAELGVRPDELLVVTIANLRGQKDYPNLLHAARHVLDEEPAARFVAVGQGPLESEIRRLHGQLGLGDRFAMLGERTDPTAVLAAGDVFVLASTYEGYPVALMEALAIGLPVVATSVGGVTDAVADGREGLLVPPRDPQALAAALRRMLGDSQLRLRSSAAATARSAEYDIRRTARRLESIYELLAGPRA